MYKSFRVKNFRCFKDLQVNDLGRVNLIAGKNNTGKTALLEAMYIFTRPRTPQTPFQLQHQVRALDAPNEGLPAYWKQLFSGMDTGNAIELSAENACMNHEDEKKLHPSEAQLTIMEIRDKAETRSDFNVYRNLLYRPESLQDVLNRTANSEVALKFTLRWESLEVPRPVFISSDLLDDSIQEAEEQSLFIPVHGRPSNASIADQFSQIMLEDMHRELISELSELAPNITDLRVLSPFGERMLWATFNGEQMPLRLMGEGVNRFAHFIMTMMAEGLKFLFIDEIENGIHHSVQCKVWKAIGKAARENRVQVFATTHSLEMIRAAYEAFKECGALDDLRLHRLDRNTDTGDIESVTYNRRALEALATFDFDFEVRG